MFISIRRLGVALAALFVMPAPAFASPMNAAAISRVYSEESQGRSLISTVKYREALIPLTDAVSRLAAESHRKQFPDGLRFLLTDASIELGDAEARVGNWTSAFAAWDHLDTITPSGSEFSDLRAIEISFRRPNSHTAFALYERYLFNNQDSFAVNSSDVTEAARTVLRFAISLAQKGRYREARDKLERALEQGAPRNETLYALGEVQYRLHEEAAAYDNWLTILESVRVFSSHPYQTGIARLATSALRHRR